MNRIYQVVTTGYAFPSLMTPEGYRDPEVFLFTDEHEAEQFRDHLRDLYELPDVTIDLQSIDTYDSAIERMVEVFGPSPE